MSRQGPPSSPRPPGTGIPAGWDARSAAERAAWIETLWVSAWCTNTPGLAAEYGIDPVLLREINALPAAHRAQARDEKYGVRALHESGLQRRATGRYYTPPELARRLACAALACIPHPGTHPVLDPACGAGDLLLAWSTLRLERGTSPDDILTSLHGDDIDPVGVALTRARLLDLLGPTPDRLHRLRRQIRVRNTLDAPPPPPHAILTLLNPPYRTAIKAKTGRNADERARYAQRYPLAARGAYDLGALFLEHALQATRDEGCIALLVPQALITHESSEAIRSALQQRFGLHTLLHDQRGDWFTDADIRVCAALLGGRPTRVRVGGWSDSRHTRLPCPGPAWGALLTPLATLPDPPDDWPRVHDATELRAGAAASEAYELLPHIVDDPAAQAGLRLITTGAIDPHQLRWGTQPTRYLKHRFDYPRIPGEAFPARRRAQHERPKVLVAGLSRVLEAVHDTAGTCAAAVAVLALTPRDDTGEQSPLPLPRLCCWLNSAWARAWYRKRWGGTQLGGASVPVQKKKLGALPLPPALLGAPATTPIAPLPDPATTFRLRSLRETPGEDLLLRVAEAAGELQTWEDAALRRALDALDKVSDPVLRQSRAEPILAAMVLRAGFNWRPGGLAPPGPSDHGPPPGPAAVVRDGAEAIADGLPDHGPPPGPAAVAQG